MFSKTVKRLSKYVVGLSGLAILNLSFQNCSKVNFADSADSLKSLAYSGKVLDTVTKSLKKNQTITFTAGTINGSRVGTLSLGPTPGVLNLKTGNGNYKILDATAGTVNYTPNQSFIGPDNIAMYVTDSYGDNIAGQINMTVGTNLNSIQPALAVRGMSCITCHSQVSSNIITDYGYGNSWFFDTANADSFYLDRAGTDNGLSSLALLNNSTITVPAAPVPASALSSFGFTSVVNTLADFVRARFTQGSSNLSSQVVEVAELKISIPSTTRIQSLFNNPTANQVYIPDDQDSPALSGLNYDSTNKVFVIKNLVCDGDLYLAAPVVFANASVQSISGCRIYVTSNVFITTPINSIAYNGSTNYNTQILSTQSIWMGTGNIIQNSNFCETSGGNAVGWYASNYPACASAPAANSTTPQCDTLIERAANILSRNTFSVAYPDSSSLNSLLGNSLDGSPNGSVLTDRAHVEAALGSELYDASCGAGGRSLTTNRLMLVAPYVNNRYSGDFSGSTIAEAALMSLGTFTYTFDPVFTKVSILSALDNGELISGQGL